MMMPAKMDCPECGGTGTVRLSSELHALPMGAHMQSGGQMKVTARDRPVMSCTACHWRLVGTYEGHHAVFYPPREGS